MDDLGCFRIRIGRLLSGVMVAKVSQNASDPDVCLEALPYLRHTLDAELVLGAHLPVGIVLPIRGFAQVGPDVV